MRNWGISGSHLINSILLTNRPTYSTLHHYSSLPFFTSPPLSQVQIIHSNAIKNASSQTLDVTNYILNLYTKGYDFISAQKLFDEIPDRDVKSWTILISGFSRFGHYRQGLDYFINMLNEGLVVPNQFTFASVFKCCANSNKGLVLGKAIHCLILRNGFALDPTSENAILDLYVKSEAFNYAKSLFKLMNSKDTVSWNIMMSANLSTGDIEKSVEFFKKMPEKGISSWNSIINGLLEHGFDRSALDMLYDMVRFGYSFDEVTFSTSLSLVSRIEDSKLGREIHGRAIMVGMVNNSFVKTSLIDMYCKCGQMDQALSLIPKKSSSKMCYDDLLTEKISLSTMIDGYVKKGMVYEALKCFNSMIKEKVELNSYVLTSILKVGNLNLGQQIHAYILKYGDEDDIVLSSSMVNMYAKSGKLNEARLIFEQAKTKNVVLWTSMILSYAFHGQGNEAINLFELMRSEGVKPNEVSFVGVLTACNHTGLVEKGCVYFKMMKEVYNIKPGHEHFVSMVDILGRAGKFDEVDDFIYENGISNVCEIWKVVLKSCLVYKEFEKAKVVWEKILEINPCEASSYILFSNVCSDNENWDEAAKLRGLMQEKKVKKLVGQSWVV